MLFTKIKNLCSAFSSTNCQFVIGEISLKIHSVKSDYDSTALSNVILPQTHVLLS